MSYKEKIRIAEKIGEYLRLGYTKEFIQKKVKGFSEELFFVAKAGIKNKREEKINQKYLFNEEDLRFCTNQKIAEYRADRLKCNTIVDIGSGIGIQSIEFAKKCKKVIAIEINKKRSEYARINADIENVKNIDFINDDAIKALKDIKKADIIFWDPDRPVAEKERILESLNPSFEDIILKARKISKNICIELPPQIDISKIKDDVEFEYISINNQLNRLNAYFGNLKKCDVSVVSLPSGERLEYNKLKVKEPKKSDGFMDYIYEIDDAITRSGLIDFFISKLKDVFVLKVENKTYLTSKNQVQSNFLKTYKMLGKAEYSKLKDILNKNSISMVILHGKIDEKEYSKIKRDIESGLKGNHVAHLFLKKDDWIITKKL